MTRATPSDAALVTVAARFRALSDPVRLRLVHLLMDGEVGVSALLESTGLGQANLSRHLGILRRAGIVERRSQGNRAYYRLADPALAEVCEIMCGSTALYLSEELEGLGHRRARIRNRRA